MTGRIGQDRTPTSVNKEPQECLESRAGTESRNGGVGARTAFDKRRRESPTQGGGRWSRLWHALDHSSPLVGTNLQQQLSIRSKGGRAAKGRVLWRGGTSAKNEFDRLTFDLLFMYESAKSVAQEGRGRCRTDRCSGCHQTGGHEDGNYQELRNSVVRDGSNECWKAGERLPALRAGTESLAGDPESIPVRSSIAKVQKAGEEV